MRENHHFSDLVQRRGVRPRTAGSSFRALSPGATTVRPQPLPHLPPAPGHSWGEVTQQLLALPRPHNSTRYHRGPPPPPQLRLSHLNSSWCWSLSQKHPPASPPAIPTQPLLLHLPKHLRPAPRQNSCPLALLTPSLLALTTLPELVSGSIILMLQGVRAGTRPPGVRLQLCHVLAVWLWISYLPSLGLVSS